MKSIEFSFNLFFYHKNLVSKCKCYNVIFPLQNKVNFLIGRQLIKDAAKGVDIRKLSKHDRELYDKYRDVRNIFGHSKVEKDHYKN